MKKKASPKKQTKKAKLKKHISFIGFDWDWDGPFRYTVHWYIEGNNPKTTQLNHKQVELLHKFCKRFIK